MNKGRAKDGVEGFGRCGCAWVGDIPGCVVLRPSDVRFKANIARLINCVAEVVEGGAGDGERVEGVWCGDDDEEDSNCISISEDKFMIRRA